MFKPVVYKSILLVKLSGIVAKVSLLFTILSTIATILDTIESEMGWAIDAACITTYLLARSFSIYGYDKTRHVPPTQKQK